MDGLDSIIDMKYEDKNHSFVLRDKPKVKSGGIPFFCKVSVVCMLILIGVLLVVLVPTSKAAYTNYTVNNEFLNVSE